MKVFSANIRSKALFHKWLEMTSIFHGLTKQQINVLALFLFYHHELSKSITNNKILWTMVFDYETKKKIKAELKMRDAGFQNVLTALRKQGVIIDNKIVSTYVPVIQDKGKSFRILFNFNIVDG